MRRIVKLTGMLLMLILASNLSLNAQRGMRGTMDSTRMNRMRMWSDTIHRPGHGEMMNHYGMRHDSFAEGRPGMRGFERGGRGPGEYMLESVPNVTEKQKKDIADLKLKQQDEMKKFREEMTSKMQAIRDSHKKSMMSILTEEQKSFIDLKQPKEATSPAKTK
jgi:hypothetical protein